MRRAVEGRLIVHPSNKKLPPNVKLFLKLRDSHFPMPMAKTVFDFAVDSSFEAEILYIETDDSQNWREEWTSFLESMDTVLEKEIGVLNKALDKVKVGLCLFVRF